jgi:hypothetical protein
VVGEAADVAEGRPSLDPIGERPPSRTIGSPGRQNTVIVNVTVSPSRWTTNASSPISGWLRNVPYAKPKRSGSSITRTMRHAARSASGPTGSASATVNPSASGASAGHTRTPIARWHTQWRRPSAPAANAASSAPISTESRPCA